MSANIIRLKLVFCLITTAAIVTPATVHAEENANNAVGAYRSKMEKWVETRQILSEERSEWIGEKETLEATRDLLQRERENLRKEIEEFEQDGAGASEERRELLLQRAEYQRSAEALKERIRELERQVVELAPQLPDPLRDRLELLLVQIPDDPDRTDAALGQRMMNILGVLAQAEKFNSTATLVGETRAVGGGDQKVQVRTLYWGLAQAIYVDTQGQVAGIGHPTPEGWVFIDGAAPSAEAKLLLDIYEGNVDTIAFVPIPVDLQ